MPLNDQFDRSFSPFFWKMQLMNEFVDSKYIWYYSTVNFYFKSTTLILENFGEFPVFPEAEISIYNYRFS